jgi:hypothetical protein
MASTSSFRQRRLLLIVKRQSIIGVSKQEFGVRKSRACCASVKEQFILLNFLTVTNGGGVMKFYLRMTERGLAVESTTDCDPAQYRPGFIRWTPEITKEEDVTEEMKERMRQEVGL